ncbi:MAG: MinD/ParA family protein [Pseudonocardiales bacterium]|nr:MAG: MinD/ParA family protein [Pseudonocardiales bacterium]
MSYILEADPAAADMLRATLGMGWRIVGTMELLRRHLTSDTEAHTVVIGANVEQDDVFALAQSLRLTRPDLGVILLRRSIETALLTQALRAGIREVIGERDLSGIRDAAHRSATIAHALHEQAHLAADGNATPLGRLVTVFAAKGGCGKTTLATNLAAALADGGRREVCLVDLDLAFGDVAIALQLFPTHTIADAVPLSDNLDETGMVGLITPHSPGLFTLVAPLEPGMAETIPVKTIVAVLHLLKRMFPYVIVDTPPAFTDHVLAAFDASDVLALIATLDVPALKNLKLTLETLDLLNYPREKWRVLLNRADSKVGLSLADVENTLRVPISAQIPSSRDVPASVNRGVPLVLDAPGHAVSSAIRDFGLRHVVGTAERSPAIHRHPRTDGRGMFRRKAKT